MPNLFVLFSDLKSFPSQPSGVVTFPMIGKRGRMGNQLFQIAATVGIAKRNNMTWDFPPEIEKCKAGELLNLKSRVAVHKTGVIEHEEQSEMYYDVVLKTNQTHRVVALGGYFQSLLYFEDSLDLLKPIFQISDHLLLEVKAAMNHVNLDDSIGVHVRRGDYVHLNNEYRLLNADYYTSAISIAQKYTWNSGRIIIVSDDIQWCKTSLLPRMKLHSDVVFSPFQDNELLDFVLLYLVKHNVIANSSFSWWAAFLKRIHAQASSSIGVVIAPEVRYNTTGKLAFLNANNIYPKDWILI